MFKLLLAAVGTLAVLAMAVVLFAGQRLPVEEPVVTKGDRLVPHPVRVVPRPPRPEVPAAQPPEMIPLPVPRPEVPALPAWKPPPAPVEQNLCTRNGLRKVITRNGRSWRCEKP